LGGAVLDTNYIESYHPPILNMHGDADAVTPFFTAVVTPAASGLPIVEVSGGHDFGKRAENIGINNVLKPEFESDFFLGFYPFFGAGFQPYAWYDGGTPQQEVIARRYLDTVITFLAPRLKKVLDLPTITSRNERRLLDDARLDVYPNPTRDIVTIKLEHASAKMEQIVVRDMMGREVLRTLPVDGLHTVFPVHSFSPGLYFLDIHTTIGIESRKLMVE
jgi:hypothetical protein